MKITNKLAIKLLNEAVKERGKDYEYPVEWCVNFWDDSMEVDEYIQKEGDPACLIGLVLSKLGVTKDDLEWCHSNDDDVESLFSGSCMRLPHQKIHITTKALKTLAIAQKYQDVRKPWGKAVKKAIKETTRGH